MPTTRWFKRTQVERPLGHEPSYGAISLEWWRFEPDRGAEGRDAVPLRRTHHGVTLQAAPLSLKLLGRALVPL
jgi:hypothetical protein